MPGAEFSKKNKTLLSSLRDAFGKFMDSLPKDLFEQDEGEEKETKEAKSYSEQYDLIYNTLQGLQPEKYVTIDSIYDDYVVYCTAYDKGYFAAPYTIENNTVVFGEVTPVFREMQYFLADGTPYEPSIVMRESISFPITLLEVEGKPLAKIITAGQGSSAFYPKEVLMRDGPNVFKAGTQMFINHATTRERAERPEGDIKNLAAVTVADAEWRENGPDGPALYAPIVMFDDHKQMLMEKAPHTGLSINAFGDAQLINKKLTLTSLNKSNSIDFVTKAGAGGQLLLQEASNNIERNDMSDQESLKNDIMQLKEAVVSLQEQLRRKDHSEAASKIVHDMFQSKSLPAVAIDRIKENALQQIPLTESGDIDATAFKSVVNGLAMQEGNYLAKASTLGVRDVFSSQETVSDEAFEKTLQNVRKKLYGDA